MVDIQLEIARIQARIAQIAAGPAISVPALGQPGFASVLGAAVEPAEPTGNGSPAPMRWPVAGEVTSAFGERKNPMGPGDDFHPGLDIAADEGTPIAAAAPGRVIAAGPDGGYGNLVVVDDGNGVTTRYGHCSQIFARVGESVTAGQTIAAVGSTGHSTGPHVHFEVRINDRPVDPTQFLSSAQ